jgi:transcriptional regulator with XRE-family HTH domain
MTLGERIADLRKQQGLSQELLAENSHTSLRTIQRIESGRSAPRPFTLKVIAEALGVEIQQLSTSSVAFDEESISRLRVINLSALVVVLLPVLNFILPLIIWRKYQRLPIVKESGKKIVSFQILWFIVVLLTLAMTRLIQVAVTGSVAIGHIPVLSLVYCIMVIVNVALIIRASNQLRHGATEPFSFIPSLF